MARQNLWSENEVQRALALYLVTPFGKIDKNNPEIIALAKKIKRTPSSVSMKLSNLAAVDETLDRRGLANASALDRRVWQEFLRNPDFIISASEGVRDGLQYIQAEAATSNSGFGEGTDHIVQSTQRRGQSLFRRSILTSYGQRCALTDIDDPRLLVASHIVGWAERPDTRMNPYNGICLNALHDRAFDKHLISFGEDYELLVSQKLSARAQDALRQVKHDHLRRPERFLPSQEFLETHRTEYLALQN